MRPGRATVRLLLALCGTGALAALAAREPSFVQALAWLAPAAAAFLILRTGRYPAEKTLVRLSSRRCPARAAAIRRPVARFRLISPRGGLLLATALAGRAPPPLLWPRERPRDRPGARAARIF